MTNFIIENFDNVLGPGVFMMMTSTFRYPTLTPQIEDIMSKATDKFKNDPYVKDYYQVAMENQARQNGLHDAATQPQVQPQVQPQSQPDPQAQPLPQPEPQPETPNENAD